MMLARKYTTKSVNLFRAEGREVTFEGRWSLEGAKSAHKMATAGFFRPPQQFLANLTVKDAVVCSWCSICLGNWEPNDNPLIEHVKWSPKCQFMRRFPRGAADANEEYFIWLQHRQDFCERRRGDYPWIFG